MLVAVGKVIVFESKLPSLQPMTMNPFMLVIEAVTTTEFNPERGSEISRLGVV